MLQNVERFSTSLPRTGAAQLAGTLWQTSVSAPQPRRPARRGAQAIEGAHTFAVKMEDGTVIYAHSGQVRFLVRHLRQLGG